jgi:Protein of unknown function (DUF3187)
MPSKKKSGRGLARFALCGLAAALANHANAAAAPVDHPVDLSFQGLLRVRDLTPFGFRRLDMRPSHAAFGAPGAWGIEVEVAHQNTWALSNNVVDYLGGRPRGSFTPADAAALRRMPGEAYLVDLELALLDIAYNRKLTPHLGMYAVLSVASQAGGFLDSSIESFHKSLGIGSAGRQYVTRDQVNIFYKLKDRQVTLLDMTAEDAFLDPVFGLRYATSTERKASNLVFEVAIKLPIRNADAFSTGRFDAGVQTTGQWFRGRHAWYLSAAAVYVGGSGGPFSMPNMIVPTGIAGYEFRWLESTNLVAQLYVSRSAFSKGQTDLHELRSEKYQLSLGLRRRVGAGLWTFGFTENVINHNNTPDIGLQVGYTHAFR